MMLYKLVKMVQRSVFFLCVVPFIKQTDVEGEVGRPAANLIPTGGMFVTYKFLILLSAL